MPEDVNDLTILKLADRVRELETQLAACQKQNDRLRELVKSIYPHVESLRQYRIERGTDNGLIQHVIDWLERAKREVGE